MEVKKVEMEFTKEGKILILYRLTDRLVSRELLTTKTAIQIFDYIFNHQYLFDKKSNEMESVGIIAVFAATRLNFEFDRVIKMISKKTLIDTVFEEASKMKEFQEVLNAAEVVIAHLDTDGNITRPTLH